MHSFPKTPPLTPSPLPRARVAHPCKSPSSGNRSRAAPPLVQSARTRQCPASSPTRLSQPIDPGPSFSIFPNALALRPRSEEHTSELQSRLHLVCRLLLEKKKKNQFRRTATL